MPLKHTQSLTPHTRPPHTRSLQSHNDDLLRLSFHSWNRYAITESRAQFGPEIVRRSLLRRTFRDWHARFVNEQLVAEANAVREAKFAVSALREWARHTRAQRPVNAAAEDEADAFNERRLLRAGMAAFVAVRQGAERDAELRHRGRLWRSWRAFAKWRRRHAYVSQVSRRGACC